MGDTKADLRRTMLARRDLVDRADAQAAAERIATRGLAFVREKVAAGAVVSAFWPIRSEIGTRPLLDALTDAGYSTALPVTHAKGVPLEFRLWRVGDDLRKSIFGTAEPFETAQVVTPALLFVPLVAFDARGHRIGYGAGHYDATLAALRPRGVRAVGLAFDLQEIDVVPAELHDQSLDAVITDARTLVIGAA